MTVKGEVLTKKDVRERAKRSLYFFAKSVCGFNLLKPHLHLPFANYVQLHPPSLVSSEAGDWVSLRKIAWMPREHFKSTICSVALPLWLLIHDRNLTIALISAHTDNTGKWLRQIKNIIRYNSFFRWAFPEIRPGEKWDEEEIIVTRDQNLSGDAQASVTAYSINSGLASQHHNYIILDDAVNEQVAKSAVEMEKAVSLFIHLEEILRGWQNSGFLVVGTPWGREDVLAEALKQEKRGTRLKWGIGARGEFEISDSLRELKHLRPKVVAGKPILPSECDERKLKEIKDQDVEKYHFQYLCKPFDEGRNGFRMELIRDFAEFADGSLRCECHPSHYHHLSQMVVVATSDPAFTEDKRNCESSILIAAKSPCGCRFLLEEWGDFVTTAGYIDQACKLGTKHKNWLTRWGVETVNFQVALKDWLTDRAGQGDFPLNVEPYDLKPKRRDKDARIASQVTPVLQGLWHKRPAMRRNENSERPNLMEQIYRWPYSRKRDRVDAFGYFDDCWAELGPVGREPDGDVEDVNDAIERYDMHQFLQEEAVH